MKHLLITFAFLISGYSVLLAQTPPSDLNGNALRTWLKRNYYDGQHRTLGYSEARRQMYNRIDNKSNAIEGVYSGYKKNWQAGGTGTNPEPINTEHTVPQSFFNRADPMRSDIHHLFPTYANWNSTRSNHKFAEIPDNRTQKWMVLTNSQSSIPRSNRSAYSESDGSVFEPRESQKGNTARAIFYFYTMYPTQAGAISRVADINTLYQWHLNDPADATERDRNTAIADVQGDRNPYIDQPNLVARAWNLTGNPTPPNPNPVPPVTSNTLFLSEYVEGSSYNKALEIGNQTGRTVNMSGYTIRKQTNGSGAWSDEFFLRGNISNGSVYVIGNRNADSRLTSRADVVTGHPVVTFNGNDPIGLFRNGTLVDIIGRFNGGSGNFAKDQTLIRKSVVNTGSSSYTAGQWNTYASDTFTTLGSLNSGSKDGKAVIASSEVLVSTKISVYPNPSVTGRISINIPEGFKNSTVKLQIIDILGQSVYEGKKMMPNTEETFTITNLSSGLYIVKVVGEQVTTSTKFTVR